MKESITKFDLESAFKALDEIDIPAVGNVKANKPALTEIFSRKSKFDALMEEYYDVSDMTELDNAKEAREAEVAQAKLARIEKIVDLDAESPEDLLPSYVGKFIMQCPQCMTLFYKDPEDVEASEEDPNTVNVNEVCQHCGNEAGYTLIGKVGEATQDEMAEYTEEETVDVTSTEESEQAEDADNAEDVAIEDSAEDFDLSGELDELDLDLDDDEVEEHFVGTHSGTVLNEVLELHEGAGADTKQVVQAAMSKLAAEDSDTWIVTTSKILDVIPDEAVDSIIDELRNNFSDVKLNTSNRKKIENAAEGEIDIDEDTDTIGKLLNKIDTFEVAKKSPGLLKALAVVALAIVGLFEPTPIVEIVAAIVAALPSESVAKVMAIFNQVGLIGAGINKLYKASKDKKAAVAKPSEESVTESNSRLTEDAELEVSAEEFEELIKSPEFKNPMSDTAARAMMNELSDEKNDTVEESLIINNETLKYAVINPDGTYAGVPCTSEEEARELAAQREGRIIVELGALKEGIFDKLKDKFADKLERVTDKLKSREAKADWLLANALENYNNVLADTKGQLVPDKNNQKFRSFVVIGFENRDTRGNLIKSAPDFDDKNLIIGKNGVQEKDNYTAADNIAKGWSMGQGNGPAFIYLAKSKDDPEAVFLCEYFMGELKNDQLDKYVKVIKNHLKGAKLMAKGGMETSEEDKAKTTAPESEPEYRGKYLRDNLTSIMDDVDELQESSLEKLISDSLIESYGNVAGFRLSECAYENDKLAVNGTIYFTSGNTRKTTYTFAEALITADGKVSMRGLNEKLGTDKQFILTGNTDKSKTFITESFSRQ